jgi:hypothetical protein
MPPKEAPSKTKTQEAENTADTSLLQEGSEGPDAVAEDKEGEDVDDEDGIVGGMCKAADADACVSIRQHTSAYGIVGGKRTAAEADDANGAVEHRETRVREPHAHESLPHSSPYQNFVKDMSAELRITEPELKGQAKMKRLGQLWQGLSEDGHKKWVQQQQQQKYQAADLARAMIRDARAAQDRNQETHEEQAEEQGNQLHQLEQDASPPKKRRGSPPKPKNRKDDEEEEDEEEDERTLSTGITDDDVVASCGGRWSGQFKSTTSGCHARGGGGGGGGGRPGGGGGATRRGATC